MSSYPTEAGGSGSGGNNASLPRNPFQISGNDAVFKTIWAKEECVFKVDMPGCPSSSLDHWVERSNLHFRANEPGCEESGRKYKGSMLFDSKIYDVEKVKAELRDGVLWLTVPKIPGGDKIVD